MADKTKEQRKLHIAQSALNVFLEKGIDKASMDDIVQLSGLSKGTLYWYFDSKQALVIDVIKYVFQQMINGLQQLVVSTKTVPAKERLHTFITQSIDTVEQAPQMMSLYMDFFVQAWQQPAIREVMADTYNQYIALIAEIIQDGIDTGAFRSTNATQSARSIAASVDGVMAQYALAGADWNVQDTLTMLADLMLNGLTVESKGSENE